MHPLQVDATPVWKIAAFLGVDVDRAEERGEAPQPDGGSLQSGRDRDIIAERLAHARGEGPKPEADPPPASLASFVGEGFIGPPD